MTELKFSEVELQKVNLVPGDTLIVKLKGDVFMDGDLNTLKTQLDKTFKGNKVVVFMVPNDNDITLEVVSQPEVSDCSKPSSYCSDCSCGKKAIAESDQT